MCVLCVVYVLFFLGVVGVSVCVYVFKCVYSVMCFVCDECICMYVMFVSVVLAHWCWR